MISVYSYQNSKVAFQAKLKNKLEIQPIKINPVKASNRKAFWVALGSIASTTIGIISVKKHSLVKTNGIKKLLNQEQIKTFERQIQQFASDIDYRKDLLSALGLNSKDYAILRPIVGPEEYKSIIKDFSSSEVHFSPGITLKTTKQDGYDLSSVEAKTFRANNHMHTTHSDGGMTITELLEQAVDYADKVAEKLAKEKTQIAPNAPFTIAITDHDTINGCKEAVSIISKDPWKYRNLRVILGCELSVENKSVPQDIKRPIATHMLLHSINPFDKDLNKFLEDKKINREALIRGMIKQSAKKMEKLLPDTALKLDFDDAQKLYPMLKYTLIHPSLPHDYVQFRTIFSECFEKNKALQEELKLKGINVEKFDYTTPQKKHFGEINEYFGDEYWKKYQIALTKSVANLLGVSEDKAAEKIIVTPDMKNIFKETLKISNSIEPRLGIQEPAYVDLDEATELIRNQKYGYAGIAHPGIRLVDTRNYPIDKDKCTAAIFDIFKSFKEKGQDRALFVEGHYPYFGPIGANEKWLNSIKMSAQTLDLYSSGGLDTHGKSIFYSRV